MEHDFIYLPDSRRYLMRLPPEQHALQCFLLEEFGLYASAYQPLLTRLCALTRYDEYQFDGREYSLRVEQMEVRVLHQSIGQLFDDERELDPDLTTDDSNLHSECGLEDLIALLKAWQQFLPAR